MRLIKINKQQETLWKFIIDRLPASLRATKINADCGENMSTYASIEVKRKKDLIGYLPFTLGIATVGTESVELRCQEWFSCFEGLIKEYEQAAGKEVTFYAHSVN